MFECAFLQKPEDLEFEVFFDQAYPIHSKSFPSMIHEL
jgi:hypothetical protein